MPREVSERALIARINRKLRADDSDEIIRTVRKGWMSGTWVVADGDHVRFNIRHNYVMEVVDIESYGRDEGVLADDEVLANHT
jgi:hypothetical protein